MKIRWFALLAAVLASASNGCSREVGPDRTWDMLAPGLPPQVAPKWAILNMGYYALKQTHEPLFRFDANGEHSSRILETWSRSQDSRRFRLCPKAGLQFTPGQPFDAPYLTRFLNESLARKRMEGRSVAEGSCVSVTGLARGNTFLNLFSKLENSPSIPTGNPTRESGLGAFRTVSVSDDAIILERKVLQPDGYDRVVLHSYRGKDDPRLNDRGIEDFNRIPADDLPGWVKSEFTSHGAAVLKTFILLIDHPDVRVRRRVYSCLGVSELRRALMPQRESFQDLENILPLGIPGARRGRVHQVCGPGRDSLPGTPLVFENWKQGNSQALHELFAEVTRKSGISITLHQTTETGFVKSFFDKPRTFQLAVISVDAVSPDYNSFFGPVLGDPIFLSDVRVPAARAAYDALLREQDPAAKLRLAAEINRLFAEQAVLLPLYQEVRTLYYPPSLKDIPSGQDFLEYPDIGEIRI